jgi:anti-sigma regulatory factor (Ser/Thr protein kinase)
MRAELRAYFPSSRQSAVEARRLLITFVARYAFTVAELSEIECAIGEALANAAEHGHRERAAFNIRAFRDRDGLVIEVHDEGPGFALATIPERCPPDDSMRGFGIFIMRSFMDEISFSDHGRRVRLKKRFSLMPAERIAEHA